MVLDQKESRIPWVRNYAIQSIENTNSLIKELSLPEEQDQDLVSNKQVGVTV